MSDFVKPPTAASYSPPLTNLGEPISQLFDDYNGGRNQARQAAIQNAFSGGIPTDADGQPDYGAMARALFQLGDFGRAQGLLSLDRQQRIAASGAQGTPPASQNPSQWQ